jgi:thiamine-phosphate pyrophosphorylase
MNDRPDIAVLSRADGVHVGQEELTVQDARQIVGPERLIGVSTHTIEQARHAVLDGASYIGCGPTFPSNTKQFDHFPGLDFLRQVAAEISLPAFAIGGITVENMIEVQRAGLHRVAVGAAITSAMDSTATVGAFLTRLHGRT